MNRPTRKRAAVAGAVAAAVGVGVTELLAGALGGVRSLVVAIGHSVIDAVPGDVERVAIRLFGRADKPVLLTTIVVLALLLGALLGLMAARRLATSVAGFAAFSALGGLAATREPGAAGNRVALVAAAGALAGVASLRALISAATPRGDRPERREVRPTDAGVDRRGFLRLAFAGVAVAATTGISGRLLAGRQRVAAIRAAIRMPRAATVAAPAPVGADLGITGVTPLYVPNRDFYRIDTALVVPQIDTADWTLDVHGKVDRPLRLTYDELLAIPHVEADVTLACVSNEVGGDLIGNARWQGVPLHVLLERAGVQPGGEQILSVSEDGFTAGFPTRIAMEQRDAMVALFMNAEPLPTKHGFPARLVVPGLYGYVSATKWLSGIELTGWAERDGYWIPRGWSKEGPIKTQSRIDVPRSGEVLPGGRTPIAGVAWAQGRGVEGVEVRVDDGPWRPARLAASLGVNCWRQWVYDWTAGPGEHTIAVRARDATGYVQTAERTAVDPNGATGHHTIHVEVGSA
jgi:DMSO/TMAO reductase YedYZ molybdopterin-dependent catalytic subunit